ncbi:hypothetical protein [Aeromicrobium sp.]|uniref:hypothetical protein n=1 Tax=Aeromicrobium sp. TaxID=1871063 RepID=UPI0028B2448A|nr:hypothetical protein [Aeromicrobium sp.]
MRSHRRRRPVDHILIAGHTGDLGCIRAALAILPADAYGQVYVQAPAGTDLDFHAPARVTIHHIDDETGSLEDALASWICEWVPDEPDPRRRVAVWIGAHAAPHVADVHLGLDGLVDQL